LKKPVGSVPSSGRPTCEATIDVSGSPMMMPRAIFAQRAFMAARHLVAQQFRRGCVVMYDDQVGVTEHPFVMYSCHFCHEGFADKNAFTNQSAFFQRP
jgi:hypothetical protein